MLEKVDLANFLVALHSTHCDIGWTSLSGLVVVYVGLAKLSSCRRSDVDWKPYLFGVSWLYQLSQPQQMAGPAATGKTRPRDRDNSRTVSVWC